MTTITSRPLTDRDIDAVRRRPGNVYRRTVDALCLSAAMSLRELSALRLSEVADFAAAAAAAAEGKAEAAIVLAGDVQDHIWGAATLEAKRPILAALDKLWGERLRATARPEAPADEPADDPVDEEPAQRAPYDRGATSPILIVPLARPLVEGGPSAIEIRAPTMETVRRVRDGQISPLDMYAEMTGHTAEDLGQLTWDESELVFGAAGLVAPEVTR